MLKSLVPCPASTGVLGREKSTGAVNGALAYPPVNALEKEPLRGVGGTPWGEFCCCDERPRYWLRRSSPGGKADDEALNRDIADGDDCCNDAEGPCVDGE